MCGVSRYWGKIHQNVLGLEYTERMFTGYMNIRAEPQHSKEISVYRKNSIISFENVQTWESYSWGKLHQNVLRLEYSHQYTETESL